MERIHGIRSRKALFSYQKNKDKERKTTMKKLVCTFMALLLLCLCTVAYAADPLTVDITALDYQTGKAVSKTYVNNELFLLKVDLGIPRFFDLTDMELIVELDGVKLDANDLRLEAGTYYLSGIVTDQPAALRITVKDKAYDNATTAEELYNAMQKNRTVSKTYYFNAAQPAEQPIAKNPVVIPKTGGASVLAYAVSIALIGFGLAVAGKRK